LPAIAQDPEFRKRLGSRVKTLRKQRGWSQRELARRIGVVFSQINKYEGGFNVPPVEKLAELAEVLDTSIDFLVTGDETEARPIHNKRLLDRFRALEGFEADDQETVIKLIDAMIVKQRAESAVKPLERRPRAQVRRAR
jgi:transcriptional regulator with XRE-family HTH domain